MEDRVGKRWIKVEYIGGLIERIRSNGNGREVLFSRNNLPGNVSYFYGKEVIPNSGFVVGDSDSYGDLENYAHCGIATGNFSEQGKNFFYLKFNGEKVLLCDAGWYGGCAKKGSVEYRRSSWDRFGKLEPGEPVPVYVGDEIKVRTIDDFVQNGVDSWIEREHRFKVTSA